MESDRARLTDPKAEASWMGSVGQSRRQAEGRIVTRFPCGYLRGTVDLTEERERHIAERHPDLLPAHRERIAETLGSPDEIRRSARFATARLFSRWYTDLMGGKHIVVVVVSEPDPQRRHWVITAYITRRLAEGDVEWTRA